MNKYIESPSALTNSYNLVETVFVSEEIEPDPFLGLFEGKAKERNISGSNDVSVSASATGKSSGTLATIFTGLLGLAGSIAPVLPALGVGSKSRIAEANVIADSNLALYNAQTNASIATQEAKKKETEKYLMIGGGVMLLMMFMMVAFKR